MTKYLSNSIINAVKKGNLKTVQLFLKLHKNHKSILNACEEHKIGLGLFNMGDVTGWSNDRLAHLAIRHNQMKILATLVACEGIDFNLTNRDGTTPLRLAVSYRNSEAVTILLSNPDVKIDAVDVNGDTALIFAARMGSLEIVKLLLEHGANKNIKNHLGYDAAHEAGAFGREDIHDYIAAHQSTVPTLAASSIEVKDSGSINCRC